MLGLSSLRIPKEDRSTLDYPCLYAHVLQQPNRRIWVNKYNTSQKPKKSQTKKRGYGHISQREVEALQAQLDQWKF